MLWSTFTKPIRLTPSGLATLPNFGRIVSHGYERISVGWSD